MALPLPCPAVSWGGALVMLPQRPGLIPFVRLCAARYFVAWRSQLYYRPVNRDLQRLESVSRSPIFAQFSETLNGVSTLRAYNQQVCSSLLASVARA